MVWGLLTRPYHLQIPQYFYTATLRTGLSTLEAKKHTWGHRKCYRCVRSLQLFWKNCVEKHYIKPAFVSNKIAVGHIHDVWILMISSSPTVIVQDSLTLHIPLGLILTEPCIPPPPPHHSHRNFRKERRSYSFPMASAQVSDLWGKIRNSTFYMLLKMIQTQFWSVSFLMSLLVLIITSYILFISVSHQTWIDIRQPDYIVFLLGCPLGQPQNWFLSFQDCLSLRALHIWDQTSLGFRR
jgi:hypothetical protein